MFSGIIEQLGAVTALAPRGQGISLAVRSALPVAPPGAAGVGAADRERVGVGDSIAVNGVCLTVESVAPPDTFHLAAGQETLAVTTLGSLEVGSRVHLERALRVGDRLDGHLVQGHVDGVGRVLRAEDSAESWILWVESPPELSRYIATKGSIAIDGVSLTVNEIDGDAFRVNIIPHTRDVTLLGALRPADAVNLEVDLLARYLERMLGGREAGGGKLTFERLAELGFGGSGRRGGS